MEEIKQVKNHKGKKGKRGKKKGKDRGRQRKGNGGETKSEECGEIKRTKIYKENGKMKTLKG